MGVSTDSLESRFSKSSKLICLPPFFYPYVCLPSEDSETVSLGMNSLHLCNRILEAVALEENHRAPEQEGVKEDSCSDPFILVLLSFITYFYVPNDLHIQFSIIATLQNGCFCFIYRSRDRGSERLITD